MMAAGVLAPIPACIFFAFIQRYLVQGLTAGALRGWGGGGRTQMSGSPLRPRQW